MKKLLISIFSIFLRYKFAFLFILIINSIIYGLSCLFIELDFLNLFLVKIQSMILGKGLHFLFSRLGWCAGGLLITALFTLFHTEPIIFMMDPSGNDPQINAGGAPHSPASPAYEGTSSPRLPLPSRSSSPLPSISSWGGSWIEETYGDQGEASSSAPNRQQGGTSPLHPTPPAHPPVPGGDQPPLVVEQPVPSSSTNAGPSEPGLPSNYNPLRAQAELELIRVLQKLEPSALQEAKFLRLLNRLALETASSELLIAIKEQICELEKNRPRNREQAISILERFIKNWNSQG